MKQACEVLVARLRPIADQLGPGASWADLMAAVAKEQGMMSSCKVRNLFYWLALRAGVGDGG